MRIARSRPSSTRLTLRSDKCSSAVTSGNFRMNLAIIGAHAGVRTEAAPPQTTGHAVPMFRLAQIVRLHQGRTICAGHVQETARRPRSGSPHGGVRWSSRMPRRSSIRETWRVATGGRCQGGAPRGQIHWRRRLDVVQLRDYRQNGNNAMLSAPVPTACKPLTRLRRKCAFSLFTPTQSRKASTAR